LTIDDGSRVIIDLGNPSAAPIVVQGCLRLGGSLNLTLAPKAPLENMPYTLRIPLANVSSGCISGDFSIVNTVSTTKCIKATWQRSETLESQLAVLLLFDRDDTADGSCNPSMTSPLTTHSSFLSFFLHFFIGSLLFL